MDRHQRSLPDHVAALVCALPRTGGALWLEPRLFKGGADSRRPSDHCLLLILVCLWMYFVFDIRVCLCYALHFGFGYLDSLVALILSV